MEDSSKNKKAMNGAKIAVLTICVIILTIIISCIVVLKLMPDSIGAYYIQDIFESIFGS